MLKKGSLPAYVRSLGFLGAAAIIAACSGQSNSSSALPPANANSGTAPVTTLSTTTPAFSIVQTAAGGGTYSSSLNVHLSKAPAAGNVLVLFFEQNKGAKFPYSGEVAWPTSPTGSQWSFDSATSSTAILHHVVRAGETGSYTLNVGGAGSGWEGYMVAEVAGANAANPLNARLTRSVAAGTTQFTFGSGLTPTAAGTYPVAFFSAHQSGRTWSSISSGWTKNATNSNYSQMIASGPVQGTSAVNATATLSSASAYTGSADVALLNPAVPGTTAATPAPTAAPTGGATAAPTVKPSPTAAPVAAPTSTPPTVASSGAYRYHGCLVYGPNDWFTTDLIAGGSSYVSNSIDPNSSKIIANLNNAFPNATFNGDSSTFHDEAANVATSSTPMQHVNNTTLLNDAWSDDSTNSIPWQNGFLSEGTRGCTTSSGDCHSDVVNTQTCVDYETYGFDHPAWNGSSFSAGNGYVKNLNHPWNSQMAGAYKISNSGMPMMGTTDFGEDASLTSINHIIGFIAAGSDGSPNAVGGWVAPAISGNACKSNCSYPLPMGARLRLHASYACPSASTNPQANLVCNQLKHYGMVLSDHEGGTQHVLRFGTTSSGVNPWHSSDLAALLNNLRITDFDVMTLGTIH